jgi:hypothetical protein
MQSVIDVILCNLFKSKLIIKKTGLIIDWEIYVV